MTNPLWSFSSSLTPDAVQKMRSLLADQFDRLLIMTGNKSVNPG
jgi:hypothetical protein